MYIQIRRLLNEWLDDANTAYRAFKMGWRGKPRWDPSISVKDGAVYVAWNGAMELAGWIVLRSDRSDGTDRQSKVLARSPRRSFETAIQLTECTSRYLRAVATDSVGLVIGYTPVWDSSTGEVLTADEEWRVVDTGAMLRASPTREALF